MIFSLFSTERKLSKKPLQRYEYFLKSNYFAKKYVLFVCFFSFLAKKPLLCKKNELKI